MRDVSARTRCLTSTSRGTASTYSWRYPLICKLESGELAYDNFNGHWGEQKELDGFLQAYAVEKAKIECRKRGHAASEPVEADGSIVLTIST